MESYYAAPFLGFEIRLVIFCRLSFAAKLIAVPSCFTIDTVTRTLLCAGVPGFTLEGFEGFCVESQPQVGHPGFLRLQPADHQSVTFHNFRGLDA